LPASDYEYDVFFSYRRHKLILSWIAEFESRLKFWLSQELGGKEAKIFLDYECIEIGEKWPETLRTAVASSRCLVCIWSPTYFQSSWCISEWRSFLAREQKIGLESHGLVAPIRFHDGEHFPEEAKKVQYADFADFTSTSPAFWQTQRAVDCESLLKNFAPSVANLVKRVPPFQPDWPVVEAPAIESSIAVPLRRL